jgi:hypothetical protein
MMLQPSPALLLLAAALAAPGLAAQQAGEPLWDAPRALQLVDAARERRASARADSGLVNYATRAEGFVYFYLDREDTDERILIKVDQVALDVYWAAPNRTRQRIIGMRDASRLPNRQHYHLDHLTVVQDEFPDVIRLGDGDEVREVRHPVAPGAESVYAYRLADSLTLRLPGAPEPIRVYRLDVRPRDPGRPGYVGSIYIDRATAALVRLTFTFTPSSYVDRRLDYIRITLDNGLWQGRHWLPHEQRIEIRRQLPELDLPAGSVIRGVFRIGEYRFNQDLPDGLFRGPMLTALPPALREHHEFDRGLFEGLDEDDLAPSEELDRLEAHARELIGARFRSGLPAARLRLGSASSVLRYNRAEGLFLGAGASLFPGSALVHLKAGWAFGAGHPVADLTIRPLAGPATRIRLSAYLNTPRDLGPVTPAPGLLNTLSAAFLGRDWLEPYLASGAAAGMDRRLGGRWTGGLGLEAEAHRAASRVVETSPFSDRVFPDIAPTDEGARFSILARAARVATGADAADWTADVLLRAGSWDGAGFARPVASVAAFETRREGAAGSSLRLSGGTSFGAIPAQHAFLLGGPGTLPGFGYRTFAGDGYVLLEVDSYRDLAQPWLRLRVLGAAGWAGGETAARRLDRPTTEGVRASAGVGVGLFYDLVRVHLVRGLPDGRWGVMFSVRSAFEELL